MLYIAYGSNINLPQMAFRCPNSTVIGTAMVKDWELEFRGVATIVPKKGTEVPVLLWELDPRDIPALNRYEGWPHLYRQEEIDVEVNGKTVKGMPFSFLSCFILSGNIILTPPFSFLTYCSAESEFCQGIVRKNYNIWYR